MRRTILISLLSAVVLAGSVAIAVSGDTPPDDALCVEVPELETWVCGYPPIPTTTSTQPTTTTQPPTTTTAPPTTTTAPPTTTTTSVSGLVIPETLPSNAPGFKENESFQAIISCGNTDDVQCETGLNGGLSITSIDYLAHGMPYLYPEAVEGGHNHAWWVAGDREGYRCMYGFMYDQHPNPFGNTFNPPRPGHFIARFSIVRPANQGYGKIIDKYMDEGQRFYDGSLVIPSQGAEITSEDCQSTALEPDFDYDAYVPHGADQIRVGLFRSDGAISDVRDFTQLQLNVGGHFEFVSLEDGRAQIVFILDATNKVSHVFYYDTMADGRIAVEVNGQTIEG